MVEKVYDHLEKQYLVKASVYIDIALVCELAVRSPRTWHQQGGKKKMAIQVLEVSRSQFPDSTGLVDELEKLVREKKINDRPGGTLRKYTGADRIDKKCSISYIASCGSNLLSTALQKVAGSSTLVTQKDGWSRIGSLVNFISVNSQPGFEIKVGVLERGKLRCAQQLITSAIPVQLSMRLGNSRPWSSVSYTAFPVHNVTDQRDTCCARVERLTSGQTTLRRLRKMY